MTQAEALALLYKGQTNVAVMALELGLEPDELKASFRAYVAHKPFDPNSWRHALHTNSEKP
jgi:hypothetical protein